ncbi:membrane cofactor protein-like [Cyprinodon tularosa]|uniref:membrane cofactor protein-like n=1 Tax=Cyprinodon tularosa TaxID=77115 RepID=UPI0018E1EDC9|nr:membrane cofactor protein-like [Cyprinodon tularosa]
MSISALCLLSSFGFGILAQAQQCPKPPGGQNMNLENEYISKDTFEDGSTVSFACNVGYTPAKGSPIINCNKGTWSPVTLTCKRKNCGPVEDKPNMIVEYPDETLFGDKALISCKTGYNLVGNREVKCESSGWTGRLPECEVIRCLQTVDIANGKVESPQKEEYEYGEVVQYSCDNDYALIGSSSLTCGENGKFEPPTSSSPPSCVLVQCQEPQITNGEYLEGARPPYKYKSTVTYKCKQGYKMKGSQRLTCNEKSEWSPGIPQCISSGNTLVGGLIAGLVSITVLLLQNYYR